MPYVPVSGTDLQYALIAYDADGVERTDDRDGRMSQRLLESVARDRVSDVFIMSHGWMGDIPAARRQYDARVGAMAACQADCKRMQQRPGFRPLIVGLHWPSLPWGDEDFGGSALSFAIGALPPAEAWVEAYAQRLADTPPAREALRTLFAAAQRDPSPNRLPPEAHAAYQVLNREAGLDSDGEGASPGHDRESFEPEERYQLARQEATISFGIGDFLGTVLSPLQQLSFWKMKDRGRRFGESGGHTLLQGLLGAREDLRIHLMGHSFGCVVMSACVAGPAGGTGLPRPVQSLVLVQGALSLWSYCSDIPYRRGRTGYFRPVIAGNHVLGPILTTRSRFDTAVHKLMEKDTSLTFIVDETTAAYPWAMAAHKKYSRTSCLGTTVAVSRRFHTLMSPPPTSRLPLNEEFKILIIADPAPGKELSLPHAREEAEVILKVLAEAHNVCQGEYKFRATVRVGSHKEEEADELQKLIERLRQYGDWIESVEPCDPIKLALLIVNEHYDAIHYAGHGFFDRGTKRAGWVLDRDCLLTAQEIFKVRQVPRLVFANACYSSSTDDRSDQRRKSDDPSEQRRKMVGLAQAFFARGIPNYIGAGWEVDDACAQKCAQTFYSWVLGLYGSKPATLGEALKQAREDTRNFKDTSTTWGAYQHYGSVGDKLLPPPKARAIPTQASNSQL